MQSFILKVAAPLAAACGLLGACTTTGVGTGEVVRNGRAAQAVPFAWKSTDGGITGTMTATLPGGAYSGRFVQITRQTQSDAMAPMWGGWQPGWPDWPYWGYGASVGFDAMQFSTVYSGKVIANLTGPSGSLMRCRLHMLAPASGMSGGGMGECQILNGATIDASF